MHFINSSSLVLYTFLAILSMPCVVARPVKSQDVRGLDTYLPRPDAQTVQGTIYRRTNGQASSSRTKSPSPSRADSLTAPKRIKVCEAYTTLTGRFLAESVIRSRSDSESVGSSNGGHTSDEGSKNMSDLEANGVHKVLEASTPGQCIGSGAYGTVCEDPNDGTKVVKHLQGGWDLSPGRLLKEIKYLKNAHQYGERAEYMSTDGKSIEQAWIWMKKVQGQTLMEMGFHPYSTESGNIPQAYPRKSAERQAFLDGFIEKVADRAVNYAMLLHIENLDLNLGNIKIQLDSNHKITSVDLIDWGLARTTRCKPRPREAHIQTLKRQIHAFY